jgi:ATP-dependent DNA helicase RecG
MAVSNATITNEDLSNFDPIGASPVRYEVINVARKFFEIKEDVPNIFKVLPVKNSSVLKISRTLPYTITAFFVTQEGEVTNHQIVLTFFAGKQSWWNKIFLLHNVITISGRPKLFKDKITIVHPSKVNEGKITPTENLVIIPHYKKSKIDDSKTQSFIINQLQTKPYTETVSPKINSQFRTNFTLNSALFEIHKPTSLEGLQTAKNFLASFEYISYKHTIQRINQHHANTIKFEQNFLPQLQKQLPFELTQGQVDAIEEISKFQKSDKGKLFLLQGDVGCGKTIVAIACALNAIKAEGGLQVAVLAPTQILATQLFHSFNETLSSFGISCTLVMSKDKAKEKREKLAKIKSGEVNVVVGTHAIFANAVEFQNLGFVIIDEQHKFGVRQRLELMKKSQNAKCLTMTATPIPRTLSMSMYSGVEFFAITQKPQNRLPIITTLLSNAKAGELIASTKRKFGNEFKMYWVCPLVEAESAMKSNIKEREIFLKKHFKEDEILIVHGQMKEDAINSAIFAFKENQSVRILLATTIIEVGIDIPKANIIVIESAETFGLASLHQLRGRVGRSSEQGYCILLFGNNGVEGNTDGTSFGMSEKAKERLQPMKDSNDGFYISQVDRKIRGSGNVLGDAQSGAMKFTFFDEDLHQEYLLQFEGIYFSLTYEEKDAISQIFHASVNLEFSEQ